MHTCGEVCFTLTRNDISLPIEAIVMKELGCDIIGGAPFMESNNIVLDMPTRQIVIAGKHYFGYGAKSMRRLPLAVRRSQSFLLKATSKQVILPGEFVEVHSPQQLIDNTVVAIEPRSDTGDSTWIQPMVSESIGGRIRIPNLSSSPVSVNKHQHLAQALYTLTETDILTPPSRSMGCKIQRIDSTHSHSASISIDPDKQLPPDQCRAFVKLHDRYDQVFNKCIGKYNDASGRIRASINMGPVPPPAHKARLPSYNSEKLRLLQDKMDELEDMGVLAKPEDVNITVEYSSPSFLVKKDDGSLRLVTAFNTIGTYARPPPSQSTSTDHIMTFLTGFNYIIKTDMTKQFFQLPMMKSSMKYLGTLTPFKGLRVYTRAAMGMPGSTEHLDELMSRVLGDLIQEGVVIKLADDLYTGGNSIPDLLRNWECILQRFEANNLRLSASKTVICPMTTSILGWIWSAGNIRASPHKVSSLKAAKRPATVKGLRSWLGAYKHLKSCLPHYATLLTDLESATAGRESQAHIDWSDSLIASFTKAQSALDSLKSIMVPRPEDKLIITNDGAVTKGIGAVLHILRSDKMLLGGFFSAKLKPHQKKWLPCEVEALAISSSVRHWAPYILESKHTVQILTDSRPCIQAFAKLCRGEFSHSARVSNFLSTLSRYQVSLQYIPGSVNLPSDYQSRNPAECAEKSCQICKFIDECASSTVYNLSVSDILDGQSPMPFMSPTAWKVAQQDCQALRRAYSHLLQGTRPGHKDNNIRDVKRYLRVCTIGKDGILIVRKEMPYSTARDLIVIPQHTLSGLISALHLRLRHPTKAQMIKIFHRYFYAFSADEEITNACTLCPQCAAMLHLPREIEDFSTSEKPQALGSHFACDILCRAKQRIFVIRDAFSSFTITKLITDEQSKTLKAALLETTAELKATSGCIVRVDGATAFLPLIADKDLTNKGIHLDVGRLKNRNKNPIAEKAIQELERELKCEYPEGGPVSSCVLSLVTATLNLRVRNRGLSAKEIVYQRDGFTGEHLNIDDKLLAETQQVQRKQNHGPSARSQAQAQRPASKANVSEGDLIFIKCDGNKHVARDKYMVASVEKDCLFARKLVGSQLRSKLYQLLYSEVYPVPNKCKSKPVMPDYHQDLTRSESPGDRNPRHYTKAPTNRHHAPLTGHWRDTESSEDSDSSADRDHGHSAPTITYQQPHPPPDIPALPQPERVPLLRPPPVPPDIPPDPDEPGGSDMDNGKLPTQAHRDANTDPVDPVNDNGAMVPAATEHVSSDMDSDQDNGDLSTQEDRDLDINPDGNKQDRPRRRVRLPPHLEKDYILTSPSDSD